MSQSSPRVEVNKTVRILCWIMTDPSIVYKTVHANETWMKRCDVRLIISSKKSSFDPVGIVGVNVSEGRNHIAEKSKAAWKYVYENHRDDADFFLKADPDSYVVIEILKEYLVQCDSSEPAIYGHNLFFTHERNAVINGHHYVAGEVVVLARGALIKLVTEGMQHPNCMPPGQAEDLKTCICLTEVGGWVVDTRDSWGRETFLPPFSVKYIKRTLYPSWYTDIYRRPYGYCMQGVDCISDHPIVFHYVTEEEFYLMDYLFRNRRHILELTSDSVGLLQMRSEFRFNGTK